MNRSILVGFVLLSGCLSRQARVEELVQAHRLPAALAEWEERLAEQPGDVEAQTGRGRVLVLLAEDAAADGQKARAREALKEALSHLIMAEQWKAKANVAVPAVDQLRGDVKNEFATRLQGARDLGQFLSAQNQLRGVEELLERSNLDLRAELRALHDASVAHCIALRGASATPYLAQLVWRYCGALRVPVQAAPVPAECRSALQVEPRVEPAEAAGVFTELAARAFNASAWADPRASGQVEARVAGFMPTTATALPVTLVATWSTSEPYTTTETQSESYTESYSATESYSYSCLGASGSMTTCSGTRTVMKTRPATRSVQKSVTRYRSVAHSFSYDAVEKTISHRAELQFSIALPGTKDLLTFSWSDALQQRDVEHAVTNAVAGVAPHRAQLPGPADWHARQARALAEKLTLALKRTWQRTFCEAGLEVPEHAARCLAGHAESEAAVVTLARYFGEPVDVIHWLTGAPTEP